jgi:hypothetical protein
MSLLFGVVHGRLCRFVFVLWYSKVEVFGGSVGVVGRPIVSSRDTCCRLNKEICVGTHFHNLGQHFEVGTSVAIVVERYPGPRI